jgi:hypothetical protein
MRFSIAALMVACVGCSAGSSAPPNEDGASGSSGATTGGSGGTSGASGSSGTGQGGASGASGSSGTGATGGSVPPPPPAAGVRVLTECTDPNLVGPTLVRRLSRLEYYASVRDLFGIRVSQGDLPSDELFGGTFTANVTIPLTADNFIRYDSMSRTVSDAVAANFQTLAGCAATSATCVEGFLVEKARAAFHGVLETADEDRLVALYRGIATSDPALALTTAVRFIVNSPRFLFVIDFGVADGAAAKLSGGEIAGRLASFLWRSVPDAALLAAADAGELGTPAGLRTQAERMLADPKADDVLKAFAEEWLGLIPPLPSAPALDLAIGAEPSEVFKASARGTATFAELVSSRTSRGSAELATFYGGTAAGDGSMTLPAEREGLLLRASFLRTHSSGTRASPVKRGEQIRRALLCDPISLPSEPVNMDVSTDPNVSDNDAFNMHAVEGCVGCHAQMDPIGQGFASYKADGSFDAAAVAQTAGLIAEGNLTPIPDTPFANTSELIDVLSTNEIARQCFTLQMNRFALSRGETMADACGLRDVWTAFDASGGNVRTLLVEVASSSLMSRRNLVVPGGACR